MRNQKKISKAVIVVAIVLVVVLGAGAGTLAALWGAGGQPFGGGASSPAASSGVPSSSAASLPGTSIGSGSSAGGDSSSSLPLGEITPRDYDAIPLPAEMRAMWFVFLEWEDVDWSSEGTARAALGVMFDNCVAMGLNTVIGHVRPFGDAMYKSDLYPYSHLLTGSQGQDPGYDPLAVMIEEAHTRGLRFEAMINPYRVKHAVHGPDAFSADNPATLHPEWVRDVGTTQVYDPGLPEVRQMVVDGVTEIVQNYDVDGIHFDDYFYPEGIDESFDAESYAEHGGGATLALWRQQNNNELVQKCYAAVKAANQSVSFGISPAGNNENNLQKYYADIKLWMANTGYVDYIMPQLYWGFSRIETSGRDTYGFANISAEWAGYPRNAAVKLYCGLGAYRIGLLQPDGSRSEFGHGGAGTQEEWESGHNLADQVTHLRTVEGFSGFALYRYEFLYQPNDPLSASEVENLTENLR